MLLLPKSRHRKSVKVQVVVCLWHQQNRVYLIGAMLFAAFFGVFTTRSLILFLYLNLVLYV